MDYSLGECIAYQITDFSEGDFSKFGNAVRKGAIIGAMGLASLAPAKAMSIEDQIKADTRAYVQTAMIDPSVAKYPELGKYATYNDKKNVDIADPSKLIKESLFDKNVKKETAAWGYPQELTNYKTGKTKYLESYLNGDYKHSYGAMDMKKTQELFERTLDNKTSEDSRVGKDYLLLKNKEAEKSVGDHLKDAWNSTSEAAKKTGEKISEKAGEAWDWTKDTAKNVGDKVSEGAGKAWNWMKGAGSKIADKISGSKDKEFSEGDFGINLSKIRNAGRTAALTAIIAGTATFGGWAGNKVGSSNLAIPKAQRTAIVQMEKAADNYDADAAIARLADINLAASGKAVENTGKSKAYNVAADTLREEAKSVRNKATKTSRGWGTFLGSLAGAAGGAASIGAAKRKKKENELIDKYMKNSSSAGTP